MGGGISRSSSGSDLGVGDNGMKGIVINNEMEENSSHTLCSSEETQVCEDKDHKMKEYMKDPLVQKEFRVFLNKRGKDVQLKLFRLIEVFADQVAEKYSNCPSSQLIPVKDLIIPDLDTSYINDDCGVQSIITQSLQFLDKLRTRKLVTLSLLNNQIANAEEVLISYFLDEFYEYSNNASFYQQQQNQQKAKAKALLLADDDDHEETTDRTVLTVTNAFPGATLLT